MFLGGAPFFRGFVEFVFYFVALASTLVSKWGEPAFRPRGCQPRRAWRALDLLSASAAAMWQRRVLGQSCNSVEMHKQRQAFQSRIDLAGNDRLKHFHTPT